MSQDKEQTPSYIIIAFEPVMVQSFTIQFTASPPHNAQPRHSCTLADHFDWWALQM